MVFKENDILLCIGMSPRYTDKLTIGKLYRFHILDNNVVTGSWLMVKEITSNAYETKYFINLSNTHHNKEQLQKLVSLIY